MAAPIDPPTEHPVRELKSANHTDGFYWLLVSRESVIFQQNAPLKRGQKYSDLKGAKQSVIDLHPTGLWFAEEIVPLRSSQVGSMPGERFVIWIFSTDWRAQSSTNAGITYSGGSVAHPIYARDYVIRRDAWEVAQSIATGSALTALIGATITAPGTGYTYATGAVGNATLAAVCSGGAIIAWIVTNEGSSITSAAAITITGDGTGATATTVIQPATAILVAQEKSELPQDSNLSKEFVSVRRIYETLPGPAITTTEPDYDGEPMTTTSQRMILASIVSSDAVALGVWTQKFKGEGDAVAAAQMTKERAVPGNYVPFTRYDDNLGPIQGRRRLVVNTSQAPTLTATGKITYEARAETDAVAYEVEEIWSDGTGGVGNPAYPIGDKDFFDDNRGAVQARAQLVVRTGSEVGSLTVSGGVATLTQYEPFNEFLLRRTVETFAVPGPTLRNAERYDTKLGLITSTRQLIENTGSPVQTMAAGGQTKYDASPYGTALLWKIVESWSVTFPIRTDDPFEDDRGAVQRTSQLVTNSGFVASFAISGGNLATKISYEAYNEFLVDRITETWAVPGPALRNDESYDTKLGAITGTRQLVSNSSQSPVMSASGRTRYAASPYASDLIWSIVESWSTTFPIRTDDPYEDERGAVQRTSQLITAASVAGSLTESGGTVTKITYEAYNVYLLDRITETWAATGPSRTGKAMAEDAQGAVSTVSRQLLVTGTATPTVDFKTLRYTDTPISAVQIERQTLILPDAAFPILTEYDQDEETGALITTTYQVVEASAVSAPSFTVGQITRYRKIDKWRSLKIFTTFATPSSYSEFRFAAHHFPSLLYDYEYIDDCGAIIFMRKGFSSFTDCRIDISFGSYDSSIAGLQIMPNSFRIFKFVVDEVLNDSDTLVVTGDCAGTLPIDASDPDRTAYEALIGDFSLISGESVLWKAGRFRTTRLYYRLL